jgi:hypothetical protein
MLNVLWRPRATPLLPLQVSLLLRQELPKERLEDASHDVRAGYADVLCACDAKLLEPCEPGERVVNA